MAHARAWRPASAATRTGGLWLAVAVILIAVYAAGRLVWDTGSGSYLSLAFGWAAGTLLAAVSALGVRKRALGLGERRLVQVDPNQPSRRRVQEDRSRVSSPTDGAVDVEAAGARGEHLHDLLREHRLVPFLHVISTIVVRIPNGSWKRM